MNKELLKLAYDLLTKCQSDEVFEEKARLGMGCERIAYKLNDDYIVKIAKNAFCDYDLDEDEWDDRYDYSEERQTEEEIHIWEQLTPEEKSLFNPIVASGNFCNLPFTVMPMVKIVNGNHDAREICEKNEINFNFQLLRDIAERFELDFWDMTSNTSNFGFDKLGNFVITDFGLAEYY